MFHIVSDIKKLKPERKHRHRDVSAKGSVGKIGFHVTKVGGG
jgi:hypothetical protein